MKLKKIYQKPEIEVVVFSDDLMLELPVNSVTEVDDEAAKQNFDDDFDDDFDDEDWEEYSPYFSLGKAY